MLNWFKESNRWKHFLGGIGIGLFANSLYCAAYAGVGIAGALELKDKLWANTWDWIDFSVTLVGVGIGYGIHYALFSLIF